MDKKFPIKEDLGLPNFVFALATYNIRLLLKVH